MTRASVSARVAVPVQNMILWSEDMSNAAWQKNTGVTVTANTLEVLDPRGSASAGKVVYNGSGAAGDWRMLQVGPLVNDVAIDTVSLWLRTLSGTKSLRLGDNGLPHVGPAFTITPQWQRFSYTGGSTGGAFAQNLMLFDDVGVNAAFTVYAWGGQVVQANWPGNYVKTVASTVNNGGIRNIVLRQNLLAWSEDLSNAIWQKNTGVTISAGATDVPDPRGYVGASKVTYNGSGAAGDYRFYQIGSTVFAGDAATISIWLRTLTGTRSMRLHDNASLQYSSPFVVGPAWQRFRYTAVSAGGPFSLLLAVDDDVGQNSAFTMYAWGAQIAQGTWAGDYVSTTSGGVSSGRIRNAAKVRVAP